MATTLQSPTRRSLIDGAPLLGGHLLPILTLVGGLAVYFLIFQVLVDPLNPPPTALYNAPITFLWEAPGQPAAVLASDLGARYAFAVPSVLMTLSFIAALVVGFGVVLPQFGRPAVLCGLLALPAGAVIGYIEQYANPLRAIVADCAPALSSVRCPLNLAVARAPAGSAFNADVLAQIQFLVSLNSIVSVMAIVLIGISAMFIARSVPTKDLSVVVLGRRRICIDIMLGVVGTILVFSVATTHGFYHFSAALMVPEDAAAYGKLASAGTTYWGAAYTTVLLVVVVPASLSVARDGRRVAAWTLPGATYTERLDWRKREGVELSIRDKLSLAVAGLAPVLTSPTLDLLRKAVGGG